MRGDVHKGASMKAVLSIAGSDPSGGAGIQADIKTITAHRMYAETAITSLTIQNTLGVTEVDDVNPRIVALQIDKVFEDIVPSAVKVGMVSSPQIIEVIADRLKTFEARNVVVDPVMVSTSGSRLISEEAIQTLKEVLIPLATVITPNLPEAEVLWGQPISDAASMEKAACELLALGSNAVLVKGGHSTTRADDVLVTSDQKTHWMYGEHIDTHNTHGTGCTLSSAIACNLASGFTLAEAVRKAKDYLTGALHHDPHLGKGSGPLNHMWEYENF